MSPLNLRVQYYQDSTPPDVPCREENFVRRELRFELPVEQTALLLIDLWNVHHIQSWIERAEAMTRDVIVPLIDTARATGLAIIHAPAPQIAVKHGVAAEAAAPSQPGPTWPPAEFAARQGRYAVFRGPRNQPPGIDIYWRDLESRLDISPHVRVTDSDFMIATGEQLHRLCAERGILHLVVAGFATNWCILGRDYGVRAMSCRGYNVILLRDATEGVEFPDTLDKRWATELATREVEQVWGFTASCEDFRAACAAARGEA
jgi:nicotinamidase-related amidase